MGLTEQRRIIKEVIMQSPEHMTADTIYTKARQAMPNIAVGTVYRNLGLLVDSGEIRRIVVPDAPHRYDKNTHPHEHLLCAQCGEMVDIEAGDLISHLSSICGMKVLSYDLAVVGICSQCAE